jgi:Leucine-rich repeat (LRR) protein
MLKLKVVNQIQPMQIFSLPFHHYWKSLSLCRSVLENMDGNGSFDKFKKSIGALTQLKTLDCNQYRLQEISPNIISSFIDLEELNNSKLIKWGFKSKSFENKNADF